MRTNKLTTYLPVRQAGNLPARPAGGQLTTYNKLLVVSRWSLVVSCWLLVVFFTPLTPAHAAPAINGPTGLVRMPSADVLGYKEFNLGGDYGIDATIQKGVWYYKVNLGAFRGLEMGVVGGTQRGTDQLREGVFINLKYGLSNDDSDYPLKMAIGVENLASKGQADVYMVATKYFKGGIDLSFGTMGDFPGDKFRPLGMIGIAAHLMGDYIVLMADAFAGETTFQANAGARLNLLPDIALHLNMLNVFRDPSNPNPKEPQSNFFGFSWKNPF